MFLGSKAPYGYLKDPVDKHHLIIDEAVEGNVRRIFLMAENGWGFFKIAKTLQAEGIPNPQSYAEGKHDTRWHITSVQKILQNPVYCGDLVQGRRGNRTMHGKQIQKPEEEWITVENTHEPLIDREQWNVVQKQIKSRKRSMKNGEVQMFAGLLYCSDCGSALSFSARRRKTKPDGGEYKSANVDRFLSIVEKYTEIPELTPHILHEFIEKIVVHTATDPHSKTNRRQQVDIYYKGIGILEMSKIYASRQK